ncbi:hypothetical protein IF090_01800 [Acinetobacter towneri]|uniref:hypothetical protein n=1 Tax=Acinetobacter towneri TaxID=202956 RepID=UPI001CE22EE3|nr:hypothetical protein [Acinetobacter towneri]MCA4778386.1 hypothetical protein [Acinetobacter towneri]MCA4783714.1 hypothetical protein [Acinetobacter towneri]MCA4786937.1 hypothetical protein [Acinetobacter towneri]MCA4795051.1 hypothetical protein [Acinetobacter towneri]MCA4799946.1 hypothetical protein [Acinetobacter towneri]
MPSNHTHHLYKQAHPLIRKILELEIEKRVFAKKYPYLFSELLIFRDKFSNELKNWLFDYYSHLVVPIDKNQKIDKKTVDTALNTMIKETLVFLKLIEVSITYFQTGILQISQLKLKTYHIDENAFMDFLSPYADEFKKKFSGTVEKSDLIKLFNQYSFTDLLSQNCLLNLLRDVIDISLTYTYLTVFNKDSKIEMVISHLKMYLLYKYHTPLGMNNLVSYIEEMCYSEDGEKYHSTLDISINVEDKEINWSELLTQIMVKYLDQKITLNRLNISDEKSSFFGSREHKELFNILDQLDALNNAKATSDRYDALLKNLICLIIYDLEIECSENLNNRVMEKLMSLGDLCPNYSRFQCKPNIEDHFDGQEVSLKYQGYLQPLVLEPNFTRKKKLLDSITLRPHYKNNKELQYILKKHYIMDEYKKFKLKYFN